MTTPFPWPRWLRRLATSLLLLSASGLALAEAETLLPDGRRIVLTNKDCSSCPNPAIKLVDANGKLLANLPAQEKALVLSSVAVQNGRYFVTATTGGEGMVRVYDLEKKLMSSSALPFGSSQTWGDLYDLGDGEIAVVSGRRSTYLKDANRPTQLVIYAINDGKLKALERLDLDTPWVGDLRKTRNKSLLMTEYSSRVSEYSRNGTLLRSVQFDAHAQILDMRLIENGFIENLLRVGSNNFSVRVDTDGVSYAALPLADELLQAVMKKNANQSGWYVRSGSWQLRFSKPDSTEIQLISDDVLTGAQAGAQARVLATVDTSKLVYKRVDADRLGQSLTVKLGRYSARGWPVVTRTLAYSDGSAYEGDAEGDPSKAATPLSIDYNIRSGSGRVIWAGGNQYDGEWVADRLAGRGRYSWPNAGYFDGYWADGLFGGYGERVYADGRVDRGIWIKDRLSTPCKTDEECVRLNGGTKFERLAAPVAITESTEAGVSRCAKAQVPNLYPGPDSSTDFFGQCNIAGFATTGIVVTRHKGIPVDIACLKDSKPTEKSNTEAFVPCEKYWAFVPDYCQKDDYRGQCKDGQPHGVGFRTGRRGGSKPSMGSGTMGALLSAFAPVTNYTIYIESGMFREGKLQGYGTAKSASGCGAAGCSGERVNDIGWFKQGSKAFDCATYADCIPKLSGKDLSSERQAWLTASAAAGSAAGSDATKTFEAALSAYQAKGNKDDLKRAQALAASPAERARLEYTLMQLAGFDKVLTLSSRVEGSGKSAGTEDAERLLGFFRSVSSSVPVKFSWSLAPETALLPLKQGRYAVTLKVGLKVDKMHRTCLGAACSDRVGTVPYVREVQVVLDTTNGYRAKGSFELSLDGARTSALFGTESGEAISGFAGVASIESVKLLP